MKSAAPLRALTIAGIVSICVTGCASDGTVAGVNSGGNPGPTTTYVGTFANATQSGGFTIQVGATATGTLSTGDGTMTSLTGSFDATSGALHMTGGSNSLNGTLANGTINGTFTNAGGTGQFSAAPNSSTGTVPRVYCGSYASTANNEVGWLNLVIATTGAVSGTAQAVNVSGKSAITMTGTLSGSTLTLTTSEQLTATATMSSDANSLSGSFNQSGGATGTFQASKASCGGATGVTAASSASSDGLWQTANITANAMMLVLVPTAAGLTGSGTITVAIPSYTGNDFIITSGSLTGTAVSFVGTLGSNPNPGGAPFVGAIAFTGTLTGTTSMTGTLVYTPPRTKTQTFTEQTVTGMTLTKH
jgi:trimeric autotransporter adhesin